VRFFDGGGCAHASVTAKLKAISERLAVRQADDARMLLMEKGNDRRGFEQVKDARLVERIYE
jgi:hypothetical protein